jgi:stage II sporulation protein D
MEVRRLFRPDRRLAAVASLLVVSGGCFVVPLVLSSCERRREPVVREQPLTVAGVPTVRVLLTNRPVETVVLASSGAWEVVVEGKVAHHSAASMPVTRVRRRAGHWQFGALLFPGGEFIVKPVGESYLQRGTALYRGRLHLKLTEGRKFVVVNHLDLESYLAGVLPKELYPDWSPETYRALAVAARTFAMYHRGHFGANHDYDLGADTSSQVYGGFSAETDKSWRAVQSTHGIVLACGPADKRRVFLAQYSSCCGGIVNPAKVLRSAEDIEPLRGGQRCEDCQFSKRYRWLPVRIAKIDIHRALARAYGSPAEALGGVREIRVTSRTGSGRAIWVDVVGTARGKYLRIRAEDVRLALLASGLARARKLYSMNCTMRDRGAQIEFWDGRGFGHGVGLCQYGAEGKARNGWGAEQILKFYYPGAALFKAY